MQSLIYSSGTQSVIAMSNHAIHWVLQHPSSMRKYTQMYAFLNAQIYTDVCIFKILTKDSARQTLIRSQRLSAIIQLLRNQSFTTSLCFCDMVVNCTSCISNWSNQCLQWTSEILLFGRMEKHINTAQFSGRSAKYNCFL